MHQGSAQGGRLERIWRAAAAAMGFTLMEAAILAHGAQQAVRRASLAWKAVRTAAHSRAVRAGRALLSAALRVYGWQLMSGTSSPLRCAARLDGARNYLALRWWHVVLYARAFSLSAQEAQEAVRGRTLAVLEAQRDGDDLQEARRSDRGAGDRWSLKGRSPQPLRRGLRAPRAIFLARAGCGLP